MRTNQLADYLNISDSAYNALENGTSKLDMERAIKLAKLYKISLEELVNLPPPEVANNEEIIKLKATIEIMNAQLNKVNESLGFIKTKLSL